MDTDPVTKTTMALHFLRLLKGDFFNVFIYELLFTWVFICCCCNLMIFLNEWSECVMSILGTTNIPRANVLTLSNKVALYCTVS